MCVVISGNAQKNSNHLNIRESDSFNKVLKLITSRQSLPTCVPPKLIYYNIYDESPKYITHTRGYSRDLNHNVCRYFFKFSSHMGEEEAKHDPPSSTLQHFFLFFPATTNFYSSTCESARTFPHIKVKTSNTIILMLINVTDEFYNITQTSLCEHQDWVNQYLHFKNKIQKET